jgi:hypothetical protein
LGSEETMIEIGIEVDILPLLVKQTVEKVSALNSVKTNSGSRISILSMDDFPQRSGAFEFSSRSLVFNCVNLG